MSAAPKRQLGLWVTAAIVIANMIGTGVFTTTGFDAKSLHDPVTILLLWIVGGFYALCGASCYAELGALMPKAGGEYVYLREAYHPVVGSMSGWVSLTAGFSMAIAAAAISFAAYFARLVPGVGSSSTQKLVAVALIAAITSLHAFDTKLGGRVQAVFTGVKVALIVGFVVLGLGIGHGDWSHFAPEHGGLANAGTSAFAVSLMYVTFAYSGWNAAAYIAGDVEDPGRTLPRALLLGTGAVMVLYVLLNVVYFYAVPADVLAGPADQFAPVIEVGDLAARALFGARAGELITSVIALALISAVSAMVMAGPRVYAAMAADRALPAQLGRHSARGVPSVAVLTQGVLGIAFVFVGSLEELIRITGFTLAIFASLTVGAVFVMRARGKRSPYRTFGYPVTPLAFIAISGWIAYAQITAHPLQSAVIALLVVGLGTAAHLLGGRGRGAAAGPEGPSGLPEARVVDDK